MFSSLRSLHKISWVKLALIAVLATAALVSIRPAAQMVFNTYATGRAAAKKLPIYSVDTEEKKVAISFDAAWGASTLGGG